MRKQRERSKRAGEADRAVIGRKKWGKFPTDSRFKGENRQISALGQTKGIISLGVLCASNVMAQPVFWRGRILQD